MRKSGVGSLSPKFKKTYMPHVDTMRYDLICDVCGKVMTFNRVEQLLGEHSGYIYDCLECDFHRLETQRWPLFIPGWKERNG